MLKCSQKDNKNYTFGLRKEQIKKEDIKISEKKCCSNCGVCLITKMSYCPNCGEKL